MNCNKPELLAPCGDSDALKAAVENGADAVYLGGRLFNARQFASNFDSEKLKEALDYAHVRDVKVYLAMNTLMSQSELGEALEFLQEVYLAGIDGVIVQDLGFAGLVRKAFPDLPLHASTQMTIYNIDGVKTLEEMGFKRVVLARELSLEEIGGICSNANLEVEVFVHGALCISYSGQCLMSSIIGGRSGNRGKCAQPCRLPYQLEGGSPSSNNGQNRAYYLSPKDLCSVRLLDEIAKAGVKSLKIEGRMKSPEYVAAVVRIYRKYLDRVFERDKPTVKYDIDEKDLKDLQKIFNRGGFSEGYFKGKTGKDMMSFEKPKNWGVYLGDVINYDKISKTIKVKLKEEVAIGDGIEVWNGEEESPGTIVTALKPGGKAANAAKPGETVSIGSIKGRISAGNKVFKTTDKGLLLRTRETYTGKAGKKIGIYGSFALKAGEPAVFTVKDNAGNEVAAKGISSAQEALNKPLAEERVQEQLGKTGQTPFEFIKIDVDIGNNLSLPVSEINNIRREALNELEVMRVSRYKRKPSGNLKFADTLLDFPGNNRNKKNNIKISACFYKINEEIDLAKLAADRLYLPLSYFAGRQNKREIIEAIKEEGKEVFIFIPPITRGNYDRLIKSGLKEITGTGIDGFLAGNIGTLGISGAYENISLMADYSLNVFNNAAMMEIKKLGACGATLSYELTLSQIGSFSDVEGFVKEVLVYGRIPLMMSEYCPAGSIHGNFSAASECSRACSRGDYFLKDRMGMRFPVMCDRIDCRSTVFNANVLLMADSLEKIKAAGVDMLRLNFVDESPSEIEAILRLHGDILRDGGSSVLKHEKLLKEIKQKGFTKGHYFRGV